MTDPTPAQAEVVDALFDASVETLALIAFTTGTKEQVDGMVRVLTDFAADPKRSKPKQHFFRAVAMALHDNRVRNSEWKTGLAAAPDAPNIPTP